jgi:hypothetical protein
MEPDPTGKWGSRDLSLNGGGEAQATYHASSMEGSWNYLDGALAAEDLARLKSGLEGFKFPDTDERSTGQGEFVLRVRVGGQEHLYFSKDGAYPEPAAAMVTLLKELYPKAAGVGSLKGLAWREPPAGE